MTEQQARAVVDAVNRMFASSFFDICTVNNCMAITKAVATSDFPALRLYHCVNYRDMSRETKDWLFKATMENIGNVDDFPKIELKKQSDELTTALTVQQQQSQPRPILQRLFGR